MGNAINGTGYGLTVLPFYDGFWGGVWSGASYSSGTGLTTFTGNFGTPVGGGALGDSVKPGMVVVPDLHRAVPLHIESVSINLLGSDTLTVKGDATGLGGSGTRFRIHQHAPYKYDLTDEVKRNNPCDLGARYLWSSYRRIPWTWSRAGEDPYLAWNRVYLPEIGRWTSADALASWPHRTFNYDREPVSSADPTGLLSLKLSWADWAQDRTLGMDTLAHVTNSVGVSANVPYCIPWMDSGNIGSLSEVDFFGPGQEVGPRSRPGRPGRMPDASILGIGIARPNQTVHSPQEDSYTHQTHFAMFEPCTIFLAISAIANNRTKGLSKAQQSSLSNMGYAAKEVMVNTAKYMAKSTMRVPHLIHSQAKDLTEAMVLPSAKGGLRDSGVAVLVSVVTVCSNSRWEIWDPRNYRTADQIRDRRHCSRCRMSVQSDSWVVLGNSLQRASRTVSVAGDAPSTVIGGASNTGSNFSVPGGD